MTATADPAGTDPSSESGPLDAELSRLRRRIAEIDRDLQRAIERRLRVASAIGRCKQTVGLPIRSLPVEAQVHERWERALRSLGVPRERSRVLVRWLIEESIRAQEALLHGSARSSPGRPARGARAARAKSTFVARPRRTRVLKFGGSIVGDPVRVARAVDRIVAYAAHANVVVVASAPGNLTDGILELLPPASWARSTAESLRTLTRGEELGARILDAHVRARGVPCRLRLPEDPDWPIVLRGKPGRSEVDLRRSGARARALFSAHAPSVTVLPGFVGIDRHGAPSLLPRGGSDVTAVALGRLLRAVEVTLVKDVPGLLFADPVVCPRGGMVRAIEANELHLLARGGCPLVSPEAIELIPAGLRVRVVGIDTKVGDRSGTLIRRERRGHPAPSDGRPSDRDEPVEPPARVARVLALARGGVRGRPTLRREWLDGFDRAVWRGRAFAFTVPTDQLPSAVEQLRRSGQFLAVAVVRGPEGDATSSDAGGSGGPPGRGPRSFPVESRLPGTLRLGLGSDRSQSVETAIDGDLERA